MGSGDRAPKFREKTPPGGGAVPPGPIRPSMIRGVRRLGAVDLDFDAPVGL